MSENKRTVNMSGVKKDQGGVEEETSTSKRAGASHLRGWRPTRCFVRSLWSQSPKNIRVCGAFFFLGRLTNTLKFSVDFNNKKKNQKQRKPAAESWPLPIASTPPTVSLCLSYRFCMPSSLCSASSVTGQIYLEERNVAGGEEEKNGFSFFHICTWIWQCSHS